MNGFPRSRHASEVEARALKLERSNDGERHGVFASASQVAPIGRVVSEPRSFEEIYAAYATFVWRVVRGMGVGPDVIQDAVQDVFVVVHRRLPEFDHRHSVKTWLFEIAYRVACGLRRKSARARRHEPLSDELLGNDPTPQEAAERVQSSRVLSELLDGMSDDRRVVLVLSDVEGMSAPEIAQLIGLPLNTVYSRLRRARLELSEALTTRGWRTP